MKQDEDYMLITTYQSDVSDEIPWEDHVPMLILQHCIAHHEKLRGYFE